MESPHTPVLLEQVLHYLDPRPGEKYLDLTAGYGGHAEAVQKATHNGHATLVDRDETAIKYLHKASQGKRVRLVHQDFLTASKDLASSKEQFDLILADLGTSSVHLNKQDRGFSFLTDTALDMRMDQRQDKTAAKVVNSYKPADLTRILKEYGEEPKAAQMARKIIASRPLTTTNQLADIAKSVWPGYSKQHPATRMFQAIRIEVNDELRQIKESLPIWFDLLSPGGRIVVISFHSLEDRLVKQAMKVRAGDRYDAVLKLLTNKPVTAGHAELVSNPRARSAKLRAAAKIKTQSSQRG